MSLVYLDEETVKQNLDISRLHHVIEKCLSDFSTGQINQPVRMSLPIKHVEGYAYTMPACYPAADALATKLVNFFPKNAEQGLPTHSATIILMDPHTGLNKAIMQGDYITQWRTAAASVVATKWLSESTKILAVLGTGTQGTSHAKLMCQSFPFEEVHIWNHRPEGARRLAEELAKSGTPATAYVSVSAEQAVRNADVIVTATSSSSPVLQSEWVMDGAHINAVGACRPTWQELDPKLMQRASVWADSEGGATTESGDVILSGATVQGEIGQVISGEKEADRNAVTVFKNLGMAAEDAAAASMVYNSYMEKMKQKQDI